MASVTSPRFIGRQPERVLLERTIAASRSGTAQTVLLSGEAGIGKSKLLEVVSRSARANGHRVLIGGCVSLADDVAPMAAIAEAIRGLAADTTGSELDRLLGPARMALAGLLPGLAGGGRPGDQPGLMYAPPMSRLFIYLLDLIDRLAHDAPLVMIIEDIHWADSSTLELLKLLARNLRNAPFIMIATYRVDEADPDRRLTSFVAELGRAVHPEHIALHRFSRGEVTEQIAAIRGASAALELTEGVLRRSEGNPFYVEELLAASDSEGEERWSELPSTLADVLDARLASLSAGARQVVRVAAVRGTEPSEAQWWAVTGLSESAFTAALHELLERKIFERRRVGGQEVIAFRHALLRSAAYEQLLPSERRHLHLAYARMLDSGPSISDDPFALAELARHLEAAGELERALPAALTAAAAADATYAPAIAHEQYERALRLAASTTLDAAGAGLDEIELLGRAARSAAAIGSTSRAIDHITRALELVDPAENPVRAGLLYERLGRYRWYTTDGTGALAAYAEAIRLVPMQPPSMARARVTAGLAQVLMILARFDESMRYCDEALANARAVGDRAIEAHAIDTLGVNTAYLGDTDKGVELLWAAKEMAEAAGDVEEVGRVTANLVDVLLVAARYEEAVDLGRQSFDYQREHGLVTVGIVLNYAAWALHHLARWPEALVALNKARQYPNYANDDVMNMAVSAMVEACLGDADAAQSHLDLVRPLIATAIDTQLLLPFAEAEAELALWTGKPAVGLRSVLDGIGRSEPLVGGNIKRYGPAYALGLRAAADIVERNDDIAARDRAREQGGELLTAMTSAYTAIAAHHPAHQRLAEPYLLLCQAEWTRLERAHDPDAWARAADTLAHLGRRHLVAYAHFRQAEAVLLAGGSSARARVPLLLAHRTAVDTGAEPLRRATENLARRSRIELESAAAGRRTKDARFGLTSRELDVLRLLAAGKTNRQIGEELFISGKTASVHVSSVLAKLGAARRTEAAAVAARLGLGEPAAGK